VARILTNYVKENRLKRVKIEFYSYIRRKRRNNIVKVSNYSNVISKYPGHVSILATLLKIAKYVTRYLTTTLMATPR
jgi:hypothetical protein